MRIGRRIGIVEPGHQTDVDDVSVHAVDPAAAIGIVRQRRTHRVDDVARPEASGRNLPQLLDADGVHLRIAVTIEPQLFDRRLGQRAARAFAQHDDFRHEIGPGLVVRLVVAVVIDTFVADAHADHTIAVPQ